MQCKGKYTCPKCVDSSAAPVQGSGEEVLANDVTNKVLINDGEEDDIECEGDSVPDQCFLLYENIAVLKAEKVNATGSDTIHCKKLLLGNAKFLIREVMNISGWNGYDEDRH